MARIVKTNRQYYTGQGWSDNEAEAKDFDSAKLAQEHADKHRIDAEIVDGDDDEPDEPTPVNAKKRR